MGCTSVVFPLISSGVYGFPKDEALAIAMGEISTFLMSHEMNVTLAVLNDASVKLSAAVMGEIAEYISSHEAEALMETEYGHWGRQERGTRGRALREAAYQAERSRQQFAESLTENSEAMPTTQFAAPTAGMSLDDLLQKKSETFQERLLQLIDERGMDDVTFYKKANVDRKLFSHVRCNKNYKPAMKTAVAFAIALELDKPAMVDLLARAGLAFSPSSKFDLIISFFVEKRIYDICEINAALFQYGLENLGL